MKIQKKKTESECNTKSIIDSGGEKNVLMCSSLCVCLWKSVCETHRVPCEIIHCPAPTLFYSSIVEQWLSIDKCTIWLCKVCKIINIKFIAYAHLGMNPLRMANGNGLQACYALDTEWFSAVHAQCTSTVGNREFLSISRTRICCVYLDSWHVHFPYKALW